MIDAPRIVQTSAQPTAVIHLTVPRAEIRNVMGPGLRELHAALAAQGLAPTGPWFSHHLRRHPEVFDFEISIPVASAIPPVGRVQASELPAATVARTIYRGPYEGLGAAWGEFRAWVSANGYVAAEDLWECYVSGPESGPDPDQWCTELNQPLIGHDS